MQSDGLNSAVNPVVYGDIALSIKINTHTKCIISKGLYFDIPSECNPPKRKLLLSVTCLGKLLGNFSRLVCTSF